MTFGVDTGSQPTRTDTAFTNVAARCAHVACVHQRALSGYNAYSERFGKIVRVPRPHGTRVALLRPGTGYEACPPSLSACDWSALKRREGRKAMRLINRVRALVTDESGQDLLEYALLVALIAIAASVAVGFAGAQVTAVFNNIATNIAAAL